MIGLKILLLVLYLLLLTIVFRLVDFLAWSDASSVVTLVDPIQLSLRQLRWLLHARGINYHNAIEKKDLSDLVSSSGVVTHDEVKAAEDANSYSMYETKTFNTENDLKQSIDNSEDIWLVQIVSEQSTAIISPGEWKKLVKRVHLAGIQTGMISCQNSPSLCRSNSFITSQLLVSYHYKKKYKGIHKKHYLTRQTDESAAYNWISNSLQGTLETILDHNDLQHNWLSANARNKFPVQLVYVSRNAHTPIIFAPLQMKFKNGIRLGSLRWTQDTSKLKSLLRCKAELPDTFVCLISRRQVYIYGNRQAKEMLHHLSLYMFLLNVCPDVNLLFTWSIYICNLLAGLSLFTTSNNVFTRIVSAVKSFIVYNAVLLGFWLLFSSYKPAVLNLITEFIFTYVELSATTEYVGAFRHYLLQMFYVPSAVIIGFVIFFCLTFVLLKKLKLVENEPDSDTVLSEILLSNDNNRFVGDSDISRRWIERLATPGLWLQPLVPSDYIDNLPVWEYTGVCISNSDDSDMEGSVPSTRTSSPSPSRSWMSHCTDVPRGRSCLSSSSRQRSRINRGILWSIRSCFRGRSPRIRKTPGPPKGMREENSCSVCLDNYKSLSLVSGLPCGHVFHHECILSWLHGDRHCCPICRWPAYQVKVDNLQS